MIYCTSYESPDLDGAACSIAYTEYLNSMGQQAMAVYFNGLSEETKFFQEKYGSLPITEKSGGYQDDDTFVLVDTADPEAIDPSIPVDKVIEIIDHHLVVYTDKFPKAVARVEKVGSCATLIWEKLLKNNFVPSEMAMTMLWGAIVSNTINFKNKVTTDRDRSAAEQIKSRLNISENFTKQMFAYKSNINRDNILQVLDHDLYLKELGGKKIAVSQIEITDLEKAVGGCKDLIEKFLHEVITDEGYDYALFTGIDIYEGFNILITVDENSDKFFSEAMGIDKIGSYYKTKEIIMRKEIWPKIKLA